jgi:hypothetical protein
LQDTFRDTVFASANLHFFDVRNAEVYLVDPGLTFENNRLLVSPPLLQDRNIDGPTYEAQMENLNVTPSNAATLGTTVVNLPDAVSVAYPISGGIAGSPPTSGMPNVQPLTSDAFLGGNAEYSFGGNASTADVSAVNLTLSGACSHKQKLQELLDILTCDLPPTFLGQACAPGGVDNATIADLFTVSYVDPATLTGGFFFRTDVSLVKNPFGGCPVALGLQYQFDVTSGLVPGVLSTTATELQYAYYPGSVVCTHGAAATVEQQVPVQITNAIFNQAYEKQSLSLASKTAGGLIPYPEAQYGSNFVYPATCVPGTEKPCLVDSDCPPLGTWQQYCDYYDPQFAENATFTGGVCKTTDPCGPGSYTYPDGTVLSPGYPGRLAAEDLLSLGVQNLGISLQDMATIYNTMEERDAHGRYVHFRCSSKPPSGSSCQTPVCQYVIPAKRVNPHPDTVELVFFDSATEYTNPAFPAFAMIEGATTAGFLAMCDTTPSPLATPHPYATSGLPSIDGIPIEVGCGTFGSSFGDINSACSPPPPTSCSCQTNLDCGPGVNQLCLPYAPNLNYCFVPCTPNADGTSPDCSANQQCVLGTKPGSTSTFYICATNLSTGGG